MKYRLEKQFCLMMIAGMVSCNKPNPPENPDKVYTAVIQFIDFTTGEPINNLKVKFWNYADLNIPVDKVYKDSFLTDLNGNCSFELPEIPYYINWNSDNYFDDYEHIVPGWKILKNPMPGTLIKLKTDGNTSFYEVKLFPKKEVTFHIKQVSPVKIDSNSPGEFLKLQTRAFYNGENRNEITQVTLQNILPQCEGCLPYPPIHANELLDIKVKGYLVKNLFNNIQWSVQSLDILAFGMYSKLGIIPIPNRISDIQDEILISF